MFVYFDKQMHDQMTELGRHHPWSVSESNPDFRYYDLRGATAQQIANTLEDIRAMAGTPGAIAGADFLEWANATDSPFETNDYGMLPPRPSQSQRISPHPIEIVARVSILHHDLRNNVGMKPHAFAQIVQDELKKLDSGWRDACWGWYLWPHQFDELERQGSPEALGETLVFKLWAWGATDADSHANAARAFKNLRRALKRAELRVRKNAQIKSGQGPRQTGKSARPRRG